MARPDLGNVDGDLNINGKNAAVKGVFNFFGAVSDTNFILPGSPKLFQYHQTNDPVVPCGKNKPYWGVGLGVPDNYGTVYGSCQIENRLKNLGMAAPQNETYIYNGNEHTVHDPSGLDIKMAAALEDWVCKSLSSVNSNLLPTVKFYPNPSTGRIQFEDLPISTQSIKIYDTKGIAIKTYIGYHSNISTDKLAPGIYTLQIIGPNFKSTKKIVIQ